VDQIRVFERENTRSRALYGISRSLSMLHEHFEAGYIEEAKKDIIHLGYYTNSRTIREVYSLSRKIEKSKRNLYVEHTDGGVEQLAFGLLGLYKKLKGNDEDILTVSEFINESTYFIIKCKEKNKDINEKFSIKYFLNNLKNKQ
jgi:hypothetical protein